MDAPDGETLALAIGLAYVAVMLPAFMALVIWGLVRTFVEGSSDGD